MKGKAFSTTTLIGGFWVEAINGLSEMTRCYVSEQIAAHCSHDKESFCPICSANMYLEEHDSSVLACSECNYSFDAEEDYSEDDR